MGNALALDWFGLGARAASGEATGPAQDARVVRIDGIRDPIEADVARVALEEAGIACVVVSNCDTAFGGLFVPQRAWGSVLVRADQAERALAIVRMVQERADGPDTEHEEGGDGGES